MSDEREPSGAAGTSGGAGASGFLAYWGPPVAIGLLVGLGIVLAVRSLDIGKTDVDQIIEQYEWNVYDNNLKLEEQVAKLGASARSDVVSAFEDAPGGEWADLKTWIAEMLLKDPFFDSETLIRAARSDDTWNRRCAAAALARVLREDADPDVVMPGLLEWLTDLSIDDHAIAISALGLLGPLPSQWQEPVKVALLALAEKRAPVADDDWLPEDREITIQQGLNRYASDERVQALLYHILADDTDDLGPRVAAVRALSENALFADVEAWKAGARATDETVRQAVAENLFRTPEPSFAEVLQPMHVDAHWAVRQGSLDTQVARRQETMLPVMDQLLADYEQWVRFGAMEACAVFKNSPGKEARNGMLLRLLAESDESTDVEGAILALYSISGKTFGFREVDVHQHVQEVEESALAAFMKDPEGRAEAVQKFREAFGGTAVWTKADHIGTLEKLRKHADPNNRERAERLLGELND